MFCEACKVCFHNYSCECSEYLIKSTCKHVHVVAMYEKERHNSVAAEEVIVCSNANNSVDERECLYASQEQGVSEEIPSAQVGELILEQAVNYINFVGTLGDKAVEGIDTSHLLYPSYINNIILFLDFGNRLKILMNGFNRDWGITGNKRKLEKQTYFPQHNKKRKI